MPSLRKVLMLGLAVVIVAGLVGCGPTTLQQIQRNPKEWAGKEVTVKGKCIRIVTMSGKSLYTISDGKAEVLVLPKEGQGPGKNKKVTVTAVVKADYDLGENIVQPVVLVEQ
jgi:hypothetical protein